MAEVSVDAGQLELGLIEGIHHSRTIFASVEPESMLRRAPCGLVSSAIHAYCQRAGVASRLLISTPNLTFDPDMQHVVVAITEEGPDERIVDASYSQFLGYVGLDTRYEELSGHSAFPNKTILDFPMSRRAGVTDWLTDIAAGFIDNHAEVVDEYKRPQGTGPLTSSSVKEIRTVFSEIWSPDNMKVWTPPEDVAEHGRGVAMHIPDETIVVIP